MELSALRDSPVGTDEGLGLSFEQKKRLSIAVELAASPSIIFLDEVCLCRLMMKFALGLTHTISLSQSFVSCSLPADWIREALC